MAACRGFAIYDHNEPLPSVQVERDAHLSLLSPIGVIPEQSLATLPNTLSSTYRQCLSTEKIPITTVYLSVFRQTDRALMIETTHNGCTPSCNSPSYSMSRPMDPVFVPELALVDSQRIHTVFTRHRDLKAPWARRRGGCALCGGKETEVRPAEVQRTGAEDLGLPRKKERKE